MNLKVAVTVDLRTSLFSNGINQNGLYLAMMYQDLGCEVTLLSSTVTEDGPTNGLGQLKEIGFDQIKIKRLLDTFEEHYDVVIGLGLLVEQKFLNAWKKGLKSLYYCRSKSIQRAENVNDEKSTDILANVYKQKPTAAKDPEYEECLSCQ